MNLSMLMAWLLLFCALLIGFMMGYIALQWRNMAYDERYILGLEFELQYYRSLEAPISAPLIEHEEDYHAGIRSG